MGLTLKNFLFQKRVTCRGQGSTFCLENWRVAVLRGVLAAGVGGGHLKSSSSISVGGLRHKLALTVSGVSRSSELGWNLALGGEILGQKY